MRVAVVGAGITGLVAALRLAQGGHQVHLLDAAPAVGGKLALGAGTGHDDVGLDVGAESVLARRPEAVALIRELGLGDDLVHPGGATPLIASRGGLHPMPGGTVMGVPVGPRGAQALAGLLTPEELDRVRAEPQLPAEPVTADVSVGAWVASRTGRAVVDRLTEPLLGGVYAGHADELSLQAAVPALWARAQAGGSLFADPQPVGGPEASGPVFAGLRGGVGRVPQVLLERLLALGVQVSHRTTVRALSRSAPVGREEGAPTAGGWWLETGPAPSPQHLRVDAVVLAVPAPAAAKLLAAAAPAAAVELAPVRTASVAVIATLVPADQLRGLSSSGLLVPPVEGRFIKAATFSSLKWPWLGERLAPEGLHAVRLSVGRVGEESSLQRPDDDLVAAAVADLDDLLTPVLGPALGSQRRPLAPVHAQVIRWGGSLPQYAVGHLDRIARMRAALAGTGLAVAGSVTDGVGVPACVVSATRAVQDLVAPAATEGERITV